MNKTMTNCGMETWTLKMKLSDLLDGILVCFLVRVSNTYVHTHAHTLAPLTHPGNLVVKMIRMVCVCVWVHLTGLRTVCVFRWVQKVSQGGLTH